MISLDQVLLLEQKVESAVAKIAQLQAENDALRSKCSELTNALSCKSEQLSTFELDQNKIESGIINALNRLNSIENKVLNAVGQTGAQAPVTTQRVAPQQPVSPVNQIPQQQTTAVSNTVPVQNNATQAQPAVQKTIPVQPQPVVQQNYSEPVQQQTVTPQPVQTQFYEMPPVQSEPEFEEENNFSDEDQGQFDIF